MRYVRSPLSTVGLCLATLCGALAATLSTTAPTARAAAAGPSASIPAWVDRPDQLYPAAQYLVGLGVSDSYGPEGERRGQAADRARDALAKQVRVQVSSSSSDVSSVSNATRATTSAGGTGGTDAQEASHYKGTITASVTTAVDLELAGVRVAQTHAGVDGRIYALAVLEREPAGAALKQRIGELRSQARQALAQGQAGSPAGELQSLLAARAVLAQAAGLETLVATIAPAVSGAASAQASGAASAHAPSHAPAGPSLAEVSGTIDAALGKGPATRLDHLGVKLAYRLVSSVTGQPTVLIDRFTYRDTGFSGPFSLFVTQALASQLPQLGLPVVDQAAVARAARVQDGAAGAAGEAPTALARAARADAVVYGDYSEAGAEVMVHGHLASLDGRRLASVELTVPASQLAAQALPLVPPNYDQLKQELSYLGSPEDLKPQALALNVWTDRGAGGIYTEGERVTVFLKTNKDCYVRLIYHQADGTDVQLFPNAFQEATPIKAGQVYVIPGEGHAFEVSPPFGGEVLKAFASTQPFPPLTGTDAGNGLKVVTEGTQQLASKLRGLKVTAKRAEQAEALCPLTTMARR